VHRGDEEFCPIDGEQASLSIANDILRSIQSIAILNKCCSGFLDGATEFRPYSLYLYYGVSVMTMKYQ